VTEHHSHATAGAGSPAPAVASAHPGDGRADGGRAASVDVVTPEARTELDRIRRRWSELPLAQAERRMPSLRHLLADLASRSNPEGVVVPDLGPAVVVDQLSVLVWDAYAQGNGDGIPELLTELRRAVV
jgi:hypothetical protein